MTGGQRWRERPRVATALAGGLLLLPVAAGLAAATLAAALVRRGGTPALLRVAVVLAVAAGVAVLAARASRRLLPLVSLLRLSLLFPGRAPSRFRVALQAGSTRELTRSAQRLAADPPPAGARTLDAAAAHVLTLVGAIAKHDPETRRHSERVRAYTDLLGEELRLSDADRERLRWASLLHDLGKTTVATAVLHKPAGLDPAEWDLVREHPVTGARLAAEIAPFLGPWYDTLAQHHERWDGTGYPLGLAGEEISLGARIVAVADSYDVMTTDRAYRPAMTAGAARAELVRCAGTQFDPRVVRALLDLSLDRVGRVSGRIAVLGAVPVAVSGVLHPAAHPHEAAVPPAQPADAVSGGAADER